MPMLSKHHAFANQEYVYLIWNVLYLFIDKLCDSLVCLIMREL